jgi:hypothetical protein
MQVNVILVYTAYIGVGLLHALFIGTVAFAWLGKYYYSNKWLFYILIFGTLFFFETYWIAIFNTLQMKISSSDASLHNHFNFTESTNLINKLNPGIHTFIHCLADTFISILLGTYWLKKYGNK